MERGFADVHSHFLFGLDDGARTKFETEKMLEQAYKQHIATLVATPHMTPGASPFDFALMDARLKDARAFCKQRGWRMEILPGAELLYTPVFSQYLDQYQLPTLGDSSFILLEFVPYISFKELRNAVLAAKNNGYDVLMAHAERYRCLWFGKKLERLKRETGVLCQVNANTVITGKSLLLRYVVNGWLKKGLVDKVASDAHDSRMRKFAMKDAYWTLYHRYGLDLAERLCCGFPGTADRD